MKKTVYFNNQQGLNSPFKKGSSMNYEYINNQYVFQIDQARRCLLMAKEHTKQMQEHPTEDAASIAELDSKIDELIAELNNRRKGK